MYSNEENDAEFRLDLPYGVIMAVDERHMQKNVLPVSCKLVQFWVLILLDRFERILRLGHPNERIFFHVRRHPNEGIFGSFSGSSNHAPADFARDETKWDTILRLHLL